MDKYLVSRIESYNFRMGEKVHRGFGSVLPELNQIMDKRYKDEIEPKNQ
jgi:hypothetical protein